MKNRIIVIIAALFMSVAANAQAPKAWYAGVNAGVQVFNGINDRFLDYGERIAPVAELTGGYMFNDLLSVEGNFSLAGFRGLYTTPMVEKHFATDHMFGNSHLRHQTGAYVQMDVNAVLDPIAKYVDADATHRVLPYAGLGIATGLGEDNWGLAPAIVSGVQYRYHYSSKLSFTVDFKNTWVGKQLENENCSKHALHYAYGLNFGAVFTLGQ